MVDETGRPKAILPGTQVLRMVIPAYCQDDPTLARVIDEAAADLFLRNVGDRTVAELLPREHRELPVVDPDATVLEIAAVMARSRSPLVYSTATPTPTPDPRSAPTRTGTGPSSPRCLVLSR